MFGLNDSEHPTECAKAQHVGSNNGDIYHFKKWRCCWPTMLGAFAPTFSDVDNDIDDNNLDDH